MTVANPEAHRKYAGSLLTVTRSARKPAERPVTWLTLVYRVPSEPTRHRAAVWRRLRTMGAVYVQNSVAVLPRSPERERALRTLRNEIVEKMAGKAYLLTYWADCLYAQPYQRDALIASYGEDAGNAVVYAETFQFALDGRRPDADSAAHFFPMVSEEGIQRIFGS